MTPIVDKAFAYVTNRNRLLVFRHVDAPEAGIQVPAGTIEAGEPPETAVLREAREESGLDDLRVIAFLGQTTRDMRDVGKNEVHRRWFFHLACPGNPPESWLHDETTPFGKNETIRFECYWVNLETAPFILADHGHFLSRLRSAE